MPRWDPDAPARLEVAALDLFEEDGYASTTVVAIAERAGLTKSTFFRHFANKRDVLFGGDTFARLLIESIEAAPASASTFDAITDALCRVGRELFDTKRQQFAVRRRAVISKTPELQEREALKQLCLVAAMIETLTRSRGASPLAAQVAAELGALAFRIAYEHWSAPASEVDFGVVFRRVMGEVRTTLTPADEPAK